MFLKSVDGWWTDGRIRPDLRDHAGARIPSKCARPSSHDHRGFRVQNVPAARTKSSNEESDRLICVPFDL